MLTAKEVMTDLKLANAITERSGTAEGLEMEGAWPALQSSAGRESAAPWQEATIE